MDTVNVKNDQSVLDALARSLAVETCGGCAYRPRLILDAREELTGTWLCPMIGRITCDDAPKCPHYFPALSAEPADGGGGWILERRA